MITSRRLKSITLIELIMAIVLLSIMVLAFTSIDTFSRFQVVTADRRAQVQNEISFVMTHMEQQISRAIGDRLNIPVELDSSGTNYYIRVFVDSNINGRRDGADISISYRWRSSNNRLDFCPQTGSPSTSCPGGWEQLSDNITATNFTTAFSAGNNFVEIQLTGCCDANQSNIPFACGSSDNPTTNLFTRITMPSVTTN